MVFYVANCFLLVSVLFPPPNLENFHEAQGGADFKSLDICGLYYFCLNEKLHEAGIA